jgi:hypothetical protein
MKSLEFDEGGAVIGEQVDLADGLERGGELSQGFEVGRIIVNAGDDGDSEPEEGVMSVEGPEVVENERVGDTGAFAVAMVVENLQVVEEEIHDREQLQQLMGGGESAGIQRGVDTLGLRRREQFVNESELCHGFTAGEGQAAAGLFEEWTILQELVQEFFPGILPTYQDASAGWAGVGTSAAAEAVRGGAEGIRRDRAWVG